MKIKKSDIKKFLKTVQACAVNGGGDEGKIYI